MSKYWFKPKRYGYGYYPITKEGWLATAVLLGAVFAAAYLNGLFSAYVTTREGLRFLFDLFVITFIFHLLCKGKMKGKMAWRWGKKKWFKR
jgi:hypothetical protein